jgi:hypothetical protein
MFKFKYIRILKITIEFEFENIQILKILIFWNLLLKNKKNGKNIFFNK